MFWDKKSAGFRLRTAFNRHFGTTIENMPIAQAMDQMAGVLEGTTAEHEFTRRRLDVALKKISELEKLVYVPGLWACGKCGFQVVSNFLNAKDGSVAPNNGDKNEDCPNCGIRLERVTERAAGNNMVDRCQQLLEKQRETVEALKTCRHALADNLSRDIHQVDAALAEADTILYPE